MKKIIVITILLVTALTVKAQFWAATGFGGMNRTSPTALFVDSIGRAGADTVIYIGGKAVFRSTVGGGAHGSTHVSGQSDPVPVFTSTVTGLVPSSGGGSVNYLRADGTWDAPPGGASAFLDLTDVPASYAGAAGYMTMVNGTPDGLVFTDPSGYDLSNFNDNLSYENPLTFSNGLTRNITNNRSIIY